MKATEETIKLNKGTLKTIVGKLTGTVAKDCVFSGGNNGKTVDDFLKAVKGWKLYPICVKMANDLTADEAKNVVVLPEGPNAGIGYVTSVRPIYFFADKANATFAIQKRNTKLQQVEEYVIAKHMESSMFSIKTAVNEDSYTKAVEKFNFMKAIRLIAFNHVVVVDNDEYDFAIYGLKTEVEAFRTACKSWKTFV